MEYFHHSDRAIQRLTVCMANSWVAMDRKLAKRRENPEPGLRAILNRGIREDIFNIRCCWSNIQTWKGV